MKNYSFANPAKVFLIMTFLLTACQTSAPVATATSANTVQPTNTVTPTDTASPTVAPTKTALPTPDPFFSGNGTLKSGDGNKKVNLKIINNTDKLLLVNWVNFSGGVEAFTKVGPESSTAVETYSTHAWQVVDEGGNVISEFVMTDEKNQVFEIDADLHVAYQPTPLPVPTFGPDIPVTERAYADRPDDHPDQYQFHVLYVLPAEANDRQIDLDGTAARSVEAINKWFSEQSGGSTLRFDTYQGQLDVTFVQLEITNKEFLSNTVKTYDSNIFNRDYLEHTLNKMRIFHPGKIYIAFLDISTAPNACADASHFPDLPGRLAGLYEIANSGGYQCANEAYGEGNPAGDLIMIHEAIHTLGFASQCGRNQASKDNVSHTGDDNRDLMWAPAPGYSGTGWDPDHMLLDPGNDDYFKHNIPNCLDLSQSAFLEPLPNNPQLPPGWPDEWKLP